MASFERISKAHKAVVARKQEADSTRTPDHAATQLVQRMLGGKSPSSGRFPIQAKLTVGPVGDKHEQEADRVAEQVMKMPDPQATAQRKEEGGSGVLQRQGSELYSALQRQEAPEDEAQMKPLVQRDESAEQEDEEVQLKPLVQRAAPDGAGGFEASSGMESQLSSSKGAGSPLPDGVRESMESKFGSDFSSVRVHTGEESVQMNREVGAQAFTHGNDIYFNEGKFSPGSSDGQQLLAHELTHTIQQTGGKSLQKKKA